MFQVKYIPVYFLMFTIVICMFRAFIGPRNADRLIAVNVISTKVTVLLAIISVLMGKRYYDDVVLVYALIGYLATVIISNYVDEKRER